MNRYIDSLPDQIQFALSFQAMVRNMTTADYVRDIQNTIDAAYDRRYAPWNAELSEIRRSFMQKPTVYEYLLWIIARANLTGNAGAVA